MPPKAPSFETPKPAVPCPRCGEPLAEASPKLLKAMQLEEAEHLAILSCRRCLIMGAVVDGIQTEWRPAGPRQFDQVARDADDGLRLRHMLASDEYDPMWTRL